MSKYIVVFKSATPQAEIDKQAAQVEANGGIITQRYNLPGMKGFSAVLPETYLQLLQSNLTGGEIDYIEPDGVVTTQ